MLRDKVLIFILMHDQEKVLYMLWFYRHILNRSNVFINHSCYENENQTYVPLRITARWKLDSIST